MEDALTIFAIMERGQSFRAKERRIKSPHPCGDVRSLVNVWNCFKRLDYRTKSMNKSDRDRQGTTEKNKGFSFCRTLKILGKEGENTQKQRKGQNEKGRKPKKTRKRGSRKSWEGSGEGFSEGSEKGAFFYDGFCIKKGSDKGSQKGF